MPVNTNNSMMLPAVLGVVGTLALAGAVLLVPVMARRWAEDRVAKMSAQQPKAPSRPAASRPAPPPTKKPPAKQAPTPEEPKAEQPSPPAAPPEIPARAPGGGHPSWRIVVSPKGYAIDANGERAVVEITGYLKANEGTRAKVTGMNSPKYSSKRAKVAARRIRDMVAEAGVSKRRMWTEAIQTEESSGFEVVVTVVGGDR